MKNEVIYITISSFTKDIVRFTHPFRFNGKMIKEMERNEFWHDIDLYVGRRLKIEIEHKGNSITYTLVMVPSRYGRYFLYKTPYNETAFCVVDTGKVLAAQIFGTPKNGKSMSASNPNIRFVSRSAFVSNYKGASCCKPITEAAFKTFYKAVLNRIKTNANFKEL